MGSTPITGIKKRPRLRPRVLFLSPVLRGRTARPPAGGKLAVERIETALADGINFTQETTLSGGSPKRPCPLLADVAKALPYCDEAHFLIRQYRIILSADTASEVRQMLSQKRR